MKHLQRVFQFSGVEVRTQVVDSNPWFCLTDLGSVLAMTNPRVFIQSEWCDKDGVRNYYITDALDREQETIFISEANLYAMVMRSNKKEAREFSRWVTHEVLPELRKTGTYTVEQPAPVLTSSSDPILAMLEGQNQVLNAIRGAQIRTEEKVENLDHRVQSIEERQSSSMEAMRKLPGPTTSLPDLSDRDKCRRMVELISQATGNHPGNIWAEAYRRYEYAQRVNLKMRAEKEKMERLDWIEHHGNIGILYACLNRMMHFFKWGANESVPMDANALPTLGPVVTRGARGPEPADRTKASNAILQYLQKSPGQKAKGTALKAAVVGPKSHYKIKEQTYYLARRNLIEKAIILEEDGYLVLINPLSSSA